MDGNNKAKFLRDIMNKLVARSNKLKPNWVGPKLIGGTSNETG